MERAFQYTLTLLIGAVAAMVFAQVILRYVLEAPLMGLEEMLVYPTLWLYILGSINASRENTQISANVLEVFTKTERTKLAIRTVASFATVGISIWLTWWAWDYFRYSLRVWKESPTLYIPTFYAESALFIGLTCMTIYAAGHMVRNVRTLIAGTGEKES